MNIFGIVLLTLVVYSLISTVVFIISKENEDVIVAFGLGIVGLILAGLCRIIRWIIFKFKYRIGKRSIFEETSTGNKYKCKVKDSNDIDWVPGYKMIKRYATKSEWINIPDFNKELIMRSKINCNNCKHDKPDECRCGYPYDRVKCKHDEWGAVLEFDKFESK